MLLLFFSFFFTCFLSLEEQASNSVKVLFESEFSSVPLLYEIAEYFSTNDLYFDFLKSFLNDFNDEYTNNNIYSWTLNNYIPKLKISSNALISLPMALSIHYFTPKIALYQNMFNKLKKSNNFDWITIQYNNKAPQFIQPNEYTNIDNFKNLIIDVKRTNAIDDNEFKYFNEAIFKDRDHILGNCFYDINTPVANVLIIYYTNYITKEFKLLHPIISELVNELNLCYVVRPIVNNYENLPKQQLQGYGVELAIKNMEYHVLDDRVLHNVEVGVDGEVKDNIDSTSNKVESNKTKDDITSSGIDDLNIEVSTRYSNYLYSLLNKTDSKTFLNLLEMEEDKMKEYMSKIGIQSTFTLLNIFKKLNNKFEDEKMSQYERDIRFLDLLIEFSSNFPKYAHIIPHIPAEKYEPTEGYLNIMKNYLMGGQELFLLNGVRLNTKDVDIFAFYELLNKESIYIDYLKDIIKNENKQNIIPSLLSSPITIGSSEKKRSQQHILMGMMGMGGGGLNEEDIRLDMRDSINKNKKSPIVFINNIEKDKKYSRYYPNLKPLRSMIIMQQIAPIRKNMYHVLAVFDPLDFTGLQAYSNIYSLYDQSMPIHFGILIYPKDIIKNNTKNENRYLLSKQLTSIIAYVIEKVKSPKKYGKFLELLANAMGENIHEKQMALLEKQMNGEEIDENKEIDIALFEDELKDLMIPSLDLIKEVFEHVYPSKMSIFDSEIINYDYSNYLNKVTEYVEDKGLGMFLKPVENEFDKLNKELQEDAARGGGDEHTMDTNDENEDKEKEEDDDNTSGLLLSINGRIFSHILQDLNVYEILGILMQEQRKYVMAYANKKISTKTNFNNYIYELSGVLPRFSKFLSWLSGASSDLKHNPSANYIAHNLVITIPHPQQLSNLRNLELLQNESMDNKQNELYFWIIANDSTVLGKSLIEAANNLDNTILYCKDKDSNTKDSKKDDLEDYNPYDLGEDEEEDENESDAPCIDMPVKVVVIKQNTNDYECIKNNLQLTKDNYVMINGRIIPLDHLYDPKENEEKKEAKTVLISSHDLWTIIVKCSEEIKGIVQILNNESELSSYDYFEIINILYFRYLSGMPARKSIKDTMLSDAQLYDTVDALSIKLLDEYSSKKAFFNIFIVLDPLSTNTQKMVSFLQELYLYKNTNENSESLFDITILLNPMSAMKDEINRYGLPNGVNRYYRYVYNLNNINDNINNDHALFKNMPVDEVLTMGIANSPGTWLYESLDGVYDLDNLLLEKIPVNHVNVRYKLSHILFQGQCFEEDGNPPAGLQVQLNNGLVDTIVMQNLGYFQLKTNPGLYELSLVEGRSTDVYTIDYSTLTKNNNELSYVTPDNKLYVVVDSFKSSPYRLRVKRLPGMEEVDLLPQSKQAQEQQEKQKKEQKKGGILSSLFGSLAGNSDEDEDKVEYDERGIKITKRRKDAKPDDETTVHVMSVASGHLYERFLRIMMISTLRNTKAKHVKFWFFGQFLSPRFKQFIPHFSKKYNCSIELIDYRWPEWLRQQTEKQRIIWAYKILFLDVLFPLDLERIIFIDADQVVRYDILELWNMDLEGKPYAYTPFCDSNKETEGFRFWKSGYWNNHLRGLPYHISALYVVDLIQFRAMRAGDSLRVLYDQLSADRNSLANLDQDLPNFAQHMVPIYSLPQNWLWCETWCSMEELEYAKSIDLCNNPLTKEPKIAKAKRLLNEWEQIDIEGTNFENKLIEQGLIQVV